MCLRKFFFPSRSRIKRPALVALPAHCRPTSKEKIRCSPPSEARGQEISARVQCDKGKTGASSKKTFVMIGRRSVFGLVTVVVVVLLALAGEGRARPGPGFLDSSELDYLQSNHFPSCTFLCKTSFFSLVRLSSMRLSLTVTHITGSLSCICSS